jgi:CIC family chloride channel protein
MDARDVTGRDRNTLMSAVQPRNGETPEAHHSLAEPATVGGASPVEREEARSEVYEYLHIRDLRRRIFPRAALVGLLAGLVATAFRIALSFGDGLRNSLIDLSHQGAPLGIIFPVLFGAVGSMLAVFLMRRFAPETSGSGIPHLEAVLRRHREMHWRRILPIKFAGGLAALAGGMALGREGPTVQMGGAIGDMVSRWLKVSARERFTLIAAGGGAGLAAAFNAPLAGVIFVLEEVQRDFRPMVFGAAFIAAAMANIVARVLTDQAPVFAVPSYPVLPLATLPVFIVLGLATGILGVAFNRALIGLLDLFAKIPQRYILLAAAGVGAAGGLIAWFAPLAVGGGHELTALVLQGRITLMLIPAWFLLRFTLTTTGYATGAPGGIFTPLLVLGALIGLAVGQLGKLLLPGVIMQPEVFAVVGMAAYFAAVVRAPLTGLVLILEMTGDYNQMLPLIIACFSAYALAEQLGDLPIYEKLLERDLLRGGRAPHSEGSVVIEMEVEPGSPFEGKLVRELGLPPGCILVHCWDGAHEWVPTAASRLEAHTRLTAVIAPEAHGASDLLREGCEAVSPHGVNGNAADNDHS